MYLILEKCCEIIAKVSIPHRIRRVYVTEIPADVIALPALFIHYYVLPLWHWHSVSPCFWLFVVRLFAFICHHFVHSLAVVVVAALSRQVHKEISIKMQQCRTPSLGRRAKLTNRDTFPRQGSSCCSSWCSSLAEVPKNLAATRVARLANGWQMTFRGAKFLARRQKGVLASARETAIMSWGK